MPGSSRKCQINLENIGKKLNNPNTSQKSYCSLIYFSRQCKPVINDSVLPNFSYLTNEKIYQMPIDNEDIVSLIRKLNPNKANCYGGISGQMLLLCNDSVVLPLRIIFRNILSTATHPDIWKRNTDI